MPINSVTKILEYRYLMRHTAIQFWLADQCYLINFPTEEHRCKFRDLLVTANKSLNSQPTLD